MEITDYLGMEDMLGSLCTDHFRLCIALVLPNAYLHCSMSGTLQE